MKYRCRILFTTRSRFEHYDTYELNEIRDTNELLALADKFYNDFSSDKDTALEIIETVHHHTFAVELAARLLQKGILTQKELLNKLKEENVRLSSADMVGMKKDGILRKDSYYGHIALFFLYPFLIRRRNISCAVCALSPIPEYTNSFLPNGQIRVT